MGTNVVRLASNLILTRLLIPEHFGLMALVNVTLMGLQMLSDVGIGPNVIQHQRGAEKAFLHTAYSVKVIRGGILFLIGAGLGWPMSVFYGLPELIWMLPVAAVITFADGFVSTKIFRENRELRLMGITLIEFAAQVSAAIVMIIVALQTRSVVALLIGGMASVTVKVVASHAFLPGFRDGFAWEPEARQSLLTFGRWVLLSTAITFLSMQIDQIVLGKLVPVEQLGVYAIAVMLASFPRQLLGQLSQRVVYPITAEIIRNNGDVSEVRTIRIRVLSILILPIAYLAGEGVAVFDILYDERYALGGEIMVILGFGTWLNALTTSYLYTVLAIGEPKWISFGNGLKALVFLSLVFPAYKAFGIFGVAGLIVVSEVAVIALTAKGVNRLGIATPLFDVATTMATLVMIYLVFQCQQFLTQVTNSPWPGLISMGSIVLLVTIIVARKTGLLEAKQSAHES